MEIHLTEPTRALLSDFEPLKGELRRALTYTDKRAEFEHRKTADSIKKFSSPGLAAKLRDSWGDEKYERVLEELRQKKDLLASQRKKCLLEDLADGLWVPSGLAKRIAASSDAPVVRGYGLPEPELMRWDHPPKYPNRPYQNEAVAALMAGMTEGPAGIELPTGAGKSSVIRDVLHELGLPAVVMAPSVSIAGQLFDDLTYCFGKRYVGLYGDGKHQYDRRIVVGVDDSLGKVPAGSEAWNALSEKPVFAADESHLTPANSLQRVCFGLMAAAPYRFFVSATQIRNDGLDLVLDGITGPIVYRKTARELIDAGWLARPTFKMVRVRAHPKWSTKIADPNKATRAHLYYNPRVIRVAADLANQFVSAMRRPTLILVEELEQFRELLPLLKHPVAFAHGPLNAKTRPLVPEAYQGGKVKDLVASFNAGEVPILIGTSCISTGTDVQVAEALIYLQGQRSEIKVRQAVGRETRGGFNGVVRNPWTGELKVDCVHVDFDVIDHHADDPEAFALHRHADERAGYYTDIYRAPELIDYTDVL